MNFIQKGNAYRIRMGSVLLRLRCRFALGCCCCVFVISVIFGCSSGWSCKYSVCALFSAFCTFSLFFFTVSCLMECQRQNETKVVFVPREVCIRLLGNDHILLWFVCTHNTFPIRMYLRFYKIIHNKMIKINRYHFMWLQPSSLKNTFRHFGLLHVRHSASVICCSTNNLISLCMCY